jgi:hypothetical protein
MGLCKKSFAAEAPIDDFLHNPYKISLPQAAKDFGGNPKINIFR